MKFKVLKESPLYGKLVAIKKRCEDVLDASEALAISVGAKHAYTNGRDKAGGVAGFYFEYGVEVDKLLWMQPDRHNNSRLFYPRSGKKYQINEPLHEKIKALPVVTYEEFNSVIGYESQWDGFTNYKSYGMAMHDDFALVQVGGKYTPIEGMIEILESEFDELSEKIKED